MSFAICLYYSEDNRQIAPFPKLLLLDEIDAPLHPSMAKTLLDTVLHKLGDVQGLHVIMATHAPSTVAVAPADSIYVMKNGVPGLHKSSKDEAISALTIGVPTLSISFSGRRQVVVESEHDAKIYSQIYGYMRLSLPSERSLTFIAVGHETNGGCQNVKRLVAEFANCGNSSVQGLLDWDKKNSGSERIHVIAKDKRYSLENIILDPFVIALLILRDIPSRIEILGLSKESSVRDFLGLPREQIQNAVERVESVLGFESKGERVDCRYGDLTLKILADWLVMPGHELEITLVDRIQELKRYAKREGELKMHVVTRVFRDMPDLIPEEMREVFISLLA